MEFEDWEEYQGSGISEQILVFVFLSLVLPLGKLDLGTVGNISCFWKQNQGSVVVVMWNKF